MLLGARLHVCESDSNDCWVYASTVRGDKEDKVYSGFVRTSQISTEQQLKIFYFDVGQGDAALIEAEGATVIIDGGPNRSLYDQLKKRFKKLQLADDDVCRPQRKRFFIDAIIVTHFDLDHYQGLTHILKSDLFKIGTIYHNGLPRYARSGLESLGCGIKHQDGSKSISSDFDDFDSVDRLLKNPQDFRTQKGRCTKFGRFLCAAMKARKAGRLASMRRLVRRHTNGSPEVLTMGALQFEILAPVTTDTCGTVTLPVFDNSDSHTINGNSIVLRLVYGQRTFLFSGDLNRPAQQRLAKKYPDMSQFRSDVSKACHHGSSDFDLSYVKKVAPHATIFSSGDAGQYGHPLPDAIGAAGKWSRGNCPLVFSTELARETNREGGVMLGHINARSNGKTVVMAQKKEKPSAKTMWHSYELP